MSERLENTDIQNKASPVPVGEQVVQASAELLGSQNDEASSNSVQLHAEPSLNEIEQHPEIVRLQQELQMKRAQTAGLREQATDFVQTQVRLFCLSGGVNSCQQVNFPTPRSYQQRLQRCKMPRLSSKYFASTLPMST
eukprot:SAG31_NODE_1297_length_8934_cov_26.567176_10_plen_138_part_00